MQKKAQILFAHGARDPRWAAPFERLQQLTQSRLPDVTVSLAFLELMTPSLPDLVAQMVADGVTDISIVPIFLGQGGHVLRDLPVILDQLRSSYPALTIAVAEAVGENATVLAAISDYCVRAL
ncbi:CbiX/SirB N-terminal domain-containing protein [Undibacterium sp. Jales W-56]|uniref:sirohydrochlorin chelatase n=1 Tax=Undibacterium sp. Jales W-56 TaxID=2897325 RepID=UPI0021CFD85F|nr:CbiX/SirB N-terminal domain-containing protein [Undibacterium sp. Jales W-56]MCU6433803.1 CbiX/SirB N-terminal domain-containing protein [Undibacterium sp. Jales W-56]